MKNLVVGMSDIAPEPVESEEELGVIKESIMVLEEDGVVNWWSGELNLKVWEPSESDLKRLREGV